MRCAGILAAACLIGASDAGAQMYKCVDARGTTHYADKPRAGCISREVDIEPIPPVWGKVTPYKEDLKAAERAFQQRRIRRERELDAERRRLADLMRRCEILNAELLNVSSWRRVPDSVAHDARIAALNLEISRKCR